MSLILADRGLAAGNKSASPKSFAFGSPSSTSGHLMPRYYLQKDGIVPEKAFKSVAYSGAHDATVAWVTAGKVDAGVLNASVWDKLVSAGKVDAAKVKLIATTQPYYDYNWTVRASLPAAVQTKLSNAFLKLSPNVPAQKEILELQRAARFVPTKAENYQMIEEAARSAGLLK